MSSNEYLAPQCGIAVLACAGRFPGARDVDEFWRNIAGGVESVRRLSAEEIARSGIDPAVKASRDFVPVANDFDGIDEFDAALFGYSPAEAAILDPQHRHLLQCTQAVFERAGYRPDRLDGRVGVYVGVGFQAYLFEQLAHRPDVQLAAGINRIFFGNDKGFAAARIAHKFDFKGPSIVIDTACSSSLMAIHMACRALLGHDCDMAVSGGASLLLPRNTGYVHQPGGIMSRDGHCRPFDAAASGTVFGSGAGVVLLRRLEDAIADGDSILAVIAGSAANNDGSMKAGFTAPSPAGQAAVIAEALAFADIDPDTIGYVEAHGTGTELGDPIEIQGLTQAFRRGTPRQGYCALGSVKGNIGHLDAAAGVAGLIKAVHALARRKLPPTINFDRPNPHIDLAASPFYVNTTLRDWPEGPTPRRAGVSAFGIGGGNVHVVLEEAPPRERTQPASGRAELLLLSAHTPQMLRGFEQDLGEALRQPDAPALSDVAWTLREAFIHRPYRRAIVASTPDDAVTLLAESSSATQAASPARTVFMFPGQGALYRGAGAQLHEREPVFREWFDRLACAFARHLPIDLHEAVLRAGTGAAVDPDTLALQAQPAIFTVSVALVHLLESKGLTPDVMIGHSLGEYVAAHVAGVFSLDDAVALIAARARLMAGLPFGAMRALPAPADEVDPWLVPGIEIAAVNGRGQCVIAGAPDAMARQLEHLEQAGRPVGVSLQTSRAFHTAAVEPLLASWRECVASVERHVPAIGFVSNVTGELITAEQACSPDYWCEHMRRTVLFGKGLEQLAGNAEVFLEVGPGSTLSSLARRACASAVASVLPTHRTEPADEGAGLLAAFGMLWSGGVDIDWSRALAAPAGHRRVALPSRRFVRDRHWIERSEGAANAGGVSSPVPRAAIDAEPPALVTTEWRELARFAVSSAPRSGALRCVASRDELAVAFGAGADAAGLVDVRLADGRSDGVAVDAVAGLEMQDILVCVWDRAADAGRLLNDIGCAIARREPAARPVLLACGPCGDGTRDFLSSLRERLPGTRMVVVDVRDEAGGSPAAAAWAEWRAGLPDDDVTWRDGVRWVLQSRDAEPALGATLRGCCLVVGDGGGAAALAIETAARGAGAVVFVRGEPVPPAGAWAVPDAALAACGARDHDDARRAAARMPAFHTDTPERLDELCAALAWDTLLKAQPALVMGACPTRAEILAAFAVQPRFERLADLLLRILEEDGILVRVGDRLQVCKSRDDLPTAIVLAAQVAQAAPELTSAVDFLRHCASHHLAVMSGSQDGVGVLFRGGETAEIDGVFHAMLSHSNYSACAARLRRLLLDSTLPAGGRPLRVLEVGAGKGELTRFIGPMLQGRAVQWCYSDLGSTFVRQAQKNPAAFGIDEIEFRLLDIGRSPLEQGFEAHAFDVVIGFDVVHATARIEQTLGNLRQLLAPGGFLALVEAVRSTRWVEMIWGLAEGWWLFEDTHERQHSPLIPAQRWVDLCARVGFEFVQAIGGSDSGDRDDSYALLVAKQPTRLDDAAMRALASREEAGRAARCGEREQWVQRARAGGARVLSIDLPGLDAAGLGRAWAEAEAQLGRVGAVFSGAGPSEPARAIVTMVNELCGERRPALLAHVVMRGQAAAGSAWQLAADHSRRTGGRAVGLTVDAALCTPEAAAQLCDAVLCAAASGSVRLEAGIARAVPNVPAAESLVARLLTIWREAFGNAAAGPDDNFFHLGGDSLLAAQVVARLRQVTQVALTVKDIFRHPTAVAMAHHIETLRAAKPDDEAPPLVFHPVPRDGILPLSRAQKAMWFADQIQGPSATYNIPGAVRLLGELDTAMLSRCLHAIVDRHEILRATFRNVDGVPELRISTGWEPDPTIRSCAAGDVRRLADEFALRPFSLDEPLFRVCILAPGPSEHVLLVNMHHIVSDGWSLGILIREIMALYGAFLAGTASPLDPQRLQFVDYADWEDRLLASAVASRDLAFWTRTLAGLAPVLTLDVAHSRPPVMKMRSAVHRFLVPQALASRAAAFARQHDVTLFTTLLTAFKVLLSRHAGVTDIAVGTTVANRQQPEVEQMVGVFVNNLVLRTELAGAKDFDGLVQHVRRTVEDAFAHQSLPFLEVVQALRPERTLAHTPLFQVLFVLQKLNLRLELPGLVAETVEIDDLHSKFDLTLFVEETSEGLASSFVYNAECFDEATVQLLARQLTALLDNLLSAPDAPLSTITMETELEREKRARSELESKRQRVTSLVGARRRAVNGLSSDLVNIEPLAAGATLPMVMQPTIPGVDAAEWIRTNRALVEDHLLRSGALLLRGFGEPSPARFENIAASLCGKLFADYGDLPKEDETSNLYGSTPYPSDREILFHNESSHMPQWPRRQFFTCLVAAQEGGETPLVDCREVYRRLPKDLAAKFAREGLLYVRNFLPGVDVSWAQFFRTSDRAEVEARCKNWGIGLEWFEDGSLKTWRTAQAVLRHPQTGETSFFNQIALHHPSRVDLQVRQSLEQLFGAHRPPRDVRFGDGQPIDDAIVSEIAGLMDSLSVGFRWQEGDVVALDNLSVAHARRTYVGPRKIAVALGDMMSASDLSAFPAGT
ncbi:MAG: acyltransferase domain-containing protein [Aquincola sp.]|nr:acyltransferase domain-containing protein [Aquincola sp.]